MSDYISREAALTELQNPELFNVSPRFLQILRDLPTADVEPERNGRWEECDWVDVDEHGFGTIRTFKAGLRCNQCACVFKKKLLWKRNYCPNCGSKMDLEDENNDD